MNAGPRTTLLAVSGMSPAILTETVWALAQDNPPILPDEVQVLTTSRGAEEIQSRLLSPQPGWGRKSPWETLRAGLLARHPGHAGKLQFAAPRVIELPDPSSGICQPATDLRSASDNAAAADFILEEVRRLAGNPDTRIIASIAGGRKTMGALLYAAMTLLARETDRVSHVLVSDPYDSCRDFFYPDQPVKLVHPSASASPVRAQVARIELADLPFAPLHNLFGRELARAPGSFHSLVAEASRRMAPPSVAVHVRMDRPCVEFAGESVRLPPRLHVLAILLARSACASAPPFPDHTKAADAYITLACELRSAASSSDFSDWRGDVPTNIDPGDIRKLANGLRTRLRQSGPHGAPLAHALESRHGLAWKIPPSTRIG